MAVNLRGDPWFRTPLPGSLDSLIMQRMKRYRVINQDFDTRARILSMTVEDQWEESVKSQWRQIKQQIVQEIAAEFGPMGLQAKLQNLVDIGAAPFSIVAFHNRFLRQARSAFIACAYYPALTAACALGERILNQLILTLRKHFRSTPEYKKVHGKQSFDRWETVIDTLQSWSILRPDVVARFRELATIRNRSLHYTPGVELSDRNLALEALKLLQTIIEEQFGAFGMHPWFIRCARGVAFLRSAVESDPFIREIYIPNCKLVGPHHRLERVGDQWQVSDTYPYEDRAVADEEFIEMFHASMETSPAAVPSADAPAVLPTH